MHRKFVTQAPRLSETLWVRTTHFVLFLWHPTGWIKQSFAIGRFDFSFVIFFFFLSFCLFAYFWWSCLPSARCHRTIQQVKLRVLSKWEQRPEQDDPGDGNDGNDGNDQRWWQWREWGMTCFVTNSSGPPNRRHSVTIFFKKKIHFRTVFQRRGWLMGDNDKELEGKNWTVIPNLFDVLGLLGLEKDDWWHMIVGMVDTSPESSWTICLELVVLEQDVYYCWDGIGHLPRVLRLVG